MEGNKLHMSRVDVYVSNLSTTCHSPDRPSTQLPQVFVVPWLNKFHQTQNRINKPPQLVQDFLSFLLQLLYHKTDEIVDPFQDGIGNLEKKLRFLLTILGDVSWSHEHDAGFQNLLAEFEAVANQAGSFLHYLFFSYDRAIEKTDEGLAAVLKHTDILKANLESSVSSISAYTSSTTDSILILHSLVDDLEDLLKREDDPIPDVKDQVKLFHQELTLCRSSIKEMTSPQPSEIEELKGPLMSIGGIAHQVEYLITSFLIKDAPLWYVFKRLNHLNQKIEIIRTGLQVITQKYQFGGLKVEKYRHSVDMLPLKRKRNSEINDTTIGFEDKAAQILDQLIGGPGNESLKVISILGMPGLGKTTSANQLYNHPLVHYTFDKLSWCVVSQTYKRQSILANILIHINCEFGKDIILNMEEICLKEHIHKTLKGRRYLIALDDIWDSNVLDELLRCFPDDQNGSRILLTSRNKDVAPPNSITHELPFLTDEQCWELLKKKAFGNRTCPPQLQGIGKKIAARCCGLPLTVVAIAGVLSTLDDKESRWEEVGGSLCSYIDGEENSVMQILELSYKHLQDHLKPCFLYFGEFKEDEEISVEKLKRLWVAEGFIHKEKGKRAEIIAGEYLMELINKSLVMNAKRRIDGGGAKSCVVHDLLRDLCLKISKEESFLKYLNNDSMHTINEKGHRVRANGDSTTLSCNQHVRSFVGDSQFSSFYVRDMRLLRVLHFKGLYFVERQRPIIGLEYLVNLRFLVIQNWPTWIDTLVNLESLRVKGTKTVYLSPTTVKMKKLRYLHAQSARYGEDWNISNQTNNLEYLSEIIIKTMKDE